MCDLRLSDTTTEKHQNCLTVYCEIILQDISKRTTEFYYYLMGMINTRQVQTCTLIWLIKDSHLINSYRVLVILDGYDEYILGEIKTLINYSRFSMILTKDSELIESCKNSVLFTEDSDVLNSYRNSVLFAKDRQLIKSHRNSGFFTEDSEVINSCIFCFLLESLN